jgi:hypothetical protein
MVNGLMIGFCKGDVNPAGPPHDHALHKESVVQNRLTVPVIGAQKGKLLVAVTTGSAKTLTVTSDVSGTPAIVFIT